MPTNLRRLIIALGCTALIAGAIALPLAAEGEDSGGNAAETQYGEGEGCTPGYWKNNASKKGAFSWVGYSPSDEFDAVFSVNWFPGITLLEALELGGGGYEALARHAVAALLNSTNTTVSGGYEYSTTKIIELVQGATDGTAELIKDGFAAANETNCTIDNSGG